MTTVMDFFQILLLPLPTLFRNTGLLDIPQRHCKCKIVKWCRCLEKKLTAPQNVKHRVTTGSSHSISRYALKRNENISLYKNGWQIFIATLFIIAKVQATQIFISSWVVRQCGISLKGRLLVDKSAMNEVVIHAKMWLNLENDPEWKDPVTEDHSLY